MYRHEKIFQRNLTHAVISRNVPMERRRQFYSKIMTARQSYLRSQSDLYQKANIAVEKRIFWDDLLNIPKRYQRLMSINQDIACFGWSFERLHSLDT